jgi:hypothetical protein
MSIWDRDKARLIRSRNQLLDFAAHGSTVDYKKIVADWVKVRLANSPGWNPQDPVAVIFEKLGRDERIRGGYLEARVYEALENCHRQLNSLRVIYRGEPKLDLTDLTESEKSHIRR